VADLHISSDIFAHHQEHLNCNYSFWYNSRVSLPTAVMTEQKLLSSSYSAMTSYYTANFMACILPPFVKYVQGIMYSWFICKKINM
jgi:hypothetical protein